MIKAIETEYKGYRFRSRLEAKWALFFDKLGIAWEYEKEGYDLGEAGWYLPDFWLPLPTIKYPNAGYFIEIKGVKPIDKYLEKLCTLSIESKHGVWCFVGEPGKQIRFTAHHSGANSWHLVDNTVHGVDPFLFDLWSTFLRFWTCSTAPPKTADAFETFEEAIAAVRHARFEHGEHGTR